MPPVGPDTPPPPDPERESEILRLDLEAATAGRYQVVREIGRGGMAVVYLARDLTLERSVAIKVLTRTFAHAPSVQERFVRETRALAALSHPNIIAIHGIETQASLLCFVMDFVDGESLSERIRRVGPLPVDDVVRILREIGWALAYAHGRGVIHRDVKPDNILLEHATGRALLTDFGIARVADSMLTTPGMALGTPNYMSPEQINGSEVDGRSDLYGLGVVGFHALTAHLPFEGESHRSVLAMHLTRPAPGVAQFRPGVPRALSAAIGRCLAKEPEARFATADALVAALPAPVPSFAEVAPAVRNFHRATNLATNQVLLLFLTLPLLTLLRPAAADVIVPLLLFGSLAITLQLRRRAQLLVARGYTIGDLRAAIAAERRARTEESQTLREVWGPRRPHWTFWAALGLGLTMVAMAGRVAERRNWIVISGVSVVGVALITELVGNPRRGRGLTSLGARFWTGAGGEWLFGLLATGDPLPSPAGRTPPETPSETWDRLGAEDRKVWEVVQRVIGDLDARRELMARREEAIERSLESASRPAGIHPAEPIDAGLLERRQTLAESLRQALDRTRLGRHRIEMCRDNLLLQVGRFRSASVDAAEALRDVEAARAVLAAFD